MDYLEARIYLQDARLRFAKRMDEKMKQALERADEALALAIKDQNDITSVALEEIMESEGEKE